MKLTGVIITIQCDVSINECNDLVGLKKQKLKEGLSLATEVDMSFVGQFGKSTEGQDRFYRHSFGPLKYRIWPNNSPGGINRKMANFSII